MNAKLEFNLPDEDFDFKAASVGTKLACAIQEIDSRVRSMAKYEGKYEINIETLRSIIRDETEDFAPWLWD